MPRAKKQTAPVIEVKALPAPQPDPTPVYDAYEVEATDFVNVPEPQPDDIVADIPPYKPEAQTTPADPLIEVVGSEPRKNKGGRPKGYTPKKQAESAPIDIGKLIDVLDLLGTTFVGEDGAFNTLERSVAIEGLNSLSRTSREAITQVADKLGPVLLIVAVALWGVRILSLRTAQVRARAQTQTPSPRAAGDTNGAPVSAPAQPGTQATSPQDVGVDPTALYNPIASTMPGGVQ